MKIRSILYFPPFIIRINIVSLWDNFSRFWTPKAGARTLKVDLQPSQYYSETSMNVSGQTRCSEWRYAGFFVFLFYNWSEYDIVMGHIFQDFGLHSPSETPKMYHEPSKICCDDSLKVSSKMRSSQKRSSWFCVFIVYFSGCNAIFVGAKLQLPRWYFTKMKMFGISSIFFTISIEMSIYLQNFRSLAIFLEELALLQEYCVRTYIHTHGHRHFSIIRFRRYMLL